VIGEILILLVLVAGNGLFAGAEIAVLTVRRSRVRELAEAGRGGARALLALRDKPERFLATVQVGITLIGATSAVFGGEFIADPLAESLERAGAGAYAEEIAFVLVVGLVTYLSLVVGELVPKSLALRHAERYASAAGRPLLWLSVALRPIVWILTVSSNAVLRLFGDQTSFTEARVSRDELRDLVEEAARTGAIDAHSSRIAARAIGFEAVTVGQLMVPRSEMVALPRRAPAEEVKRVLLERGHTRLPVYDGSPDHIAGYVVAKDILALAWEQPLVIMEDILRPALFLPEETRAVDALRELQGRKTQLAVVTGEDGGVIGLVTIEDLVEELVGEILSEHEPIPIRREPDGTALVRGLVPIREANRELAICLPEGRAWHTVAGLVIARAGHVPRPGHVVTLDDGTAIEVAEATPQRVLLVRMRPAAQRPPDS
jgi:putative hemolysin